MRLPAIEALFAELWPAAARRVLPSASPERTATAMWGPVLAWCALQILAESIDAQNPKNAAIDLFDRLRLREPLGTIFSALGIEGENHWKAAARIKVLLLVEAGAAKAEPALDKETKNAQPEASLLMPPSKPQQETEEAEPDPAAQKRTTAADEPFHRDLWHDPDVRWLTGAHKAEGHDYLVREAYEELLWWLQLPRLMHDAGEAKPAKDAAKLIAGKVQSALAAAEKAGYRIDILVSDRVPEENPKKKAADSSEPEVETAKPASPRAQS
jgi:hypothetical protein